MLFKSSKNIGLVFMDDFCKPDNVTKCSDWHRKLHDPTATKGMPPGIIALAATMVRTKMGEIKHN
jgi:hypothetical protein